MKSRWQSSSRGQPCPVCGRNIDNKCRRREDTILCWWGDRFHPPTGLQTGDVLDVGEEDWAVVNLNGGFSNNHLVLKPHIERHPISPMQRVRRRQEAQVSAPVLAGLFRDLGGCVYEILQMQRQDFTSLPLESLRQARTFINDTLRELEVFREAVLAVRREDSSLHRLLPALGIWRRRIERPRVVLERFMRHELGESLCAREEIR